MRTRRLRRTPVLTLIPAVALACSGQDVPGPGHGCTEEFRLWSVTVVDDTGSPIEALDVDVTRESTGVLLPYGQPFPFVSAGGSGSYLTMDDRMSDELRIEGETILVDGSREAISFRAEYLFGTDPERCHVRKVSGPDTVVVGG